MTTHPLKTRLTLLGVLAAFSVSGMLILARSHANLSLRLADLPAARAQLSTSASCSPPTAQSAPARPSPDDDGDGVTDEIEIADGSNSHDAGSHREHLTSPIYAMWNGYLGVTQYLELVNSGDTTTSVRLTLLDALGNAHNSAELDIQAGSERDILVNGLDGFAADRYGLLQIDLCGDTIDGRVSTYRVLENGTVAFAVSTALHPATYGASSVVFNTNSPRFDLSAQEQITENWLSIANLSDAAQQFTVERYDGNGNPARTPAGAAIAPSVVSLPARGRMDIEGGHLSSGPRSYGLIVVTPSDSSKPYSAVLNRYGRTQSSVASDEISSQTTSPMSISASGPAAQSAALTQDYQFDIALGTRAGTGERLSAPLTTTVAGQNWLEVANTQSSPTNLIADFYDENGALLDHEVQSLAARAQQHFDVNAILGDNALGHVELHGTTSNSVIAESVVYNRNPATRSLASAMASEAHQPIGSVRTGSFNLYVGMLNWLKIANLSSSAEEISVTAENATNTSEQRATIPAHASLDLGLHLKSLFGTAPDTYGIVTVSKTNPNAEIDAQILRLHQSTPSSVDFSFFTEARDVSDSTRYTLGGSISGLLGTIVLNHNGQDTTSISANGAFTFATPVLGGSSYVVNIVSQPAFQTCTISNGSGTATAAVTNVAISCPSSYPVSGTVSGLTGSVVLQNNGGDNHTISANGAFSLSSIAPGSNYHITVLSQPANQTCLVSNPNGVATAAVTNISVSCSTNHFSVGGTVSGLTGTVVLQNNGGDDDTIVTNGSFSFATSVAQGSSYNVTVLAQPATQTCTVTNGSGTMGGANVTNISVTCSTNVYTVGGTVSGLTGTLVLQDNGGDNDTITTNGSFTFPTPVAEGASYNVTVLTQPAGQTCTVTNGAGTMGGSNVTNVSVTCALSVTLTGVSPTSGPSSGGTGVTLTGTNLTNTTAVNFGSSAATAVTVINSTTVTAVTPANAAGTVDVTITTTDGSDTLTNGFTYATTAVGQSAFGGTIACLNGGLNNLIAAVSDNSTSIEWGPFGILTGASSTSDGATNTSAIVTALGANSGTPYAAQLCANYEVDSQGNTPCQAGNTCYSDWFLPAGNNTGASGQLNCLFTNQVAIGGFSNISYYSSTESGMNAAYFHSFVSGLQATSAKVSLLGVRCVRNFTP